MPELSELKNTHVGERCFVIGNGPSLADHNLSYLLDEHIFVSNRFFMHSLWEDFNNVYYFDLCGAAFLGPIIDKGHILAIRYHKWQERNILRNNKAKLIFNDKFKHNFLSASTFPKERMYFLKIRRDGAVFNGDYNFNLNTGSYFSATTTIEGCMSLAQYMGFKKIYVLGCDNTGYTQQHAYFYDLDKVPKFYLPRYDDNEGYKDMYKSWMTISKVFPDNGIEVYNASNKGKLDMFPRINYEEVFNE